MYRWLMRVSCGLAAAVVISITFAAPATAHPANQWADGIAATPANLGPTVNGVRGGSGHPWAYHQRNDYFEPAPVRPLINEWCTLVPDAVPGLFDFAHACAHHDHCYMFHTYAPRQPASKEGCDNRFRVDMRATCWEMHPIRIVLLVDVNAPTRMTCLGSADAYYNGVRFGGQAYWNSSSDPGIEPRSS